MALGDLVATGALQKSNRMDLEELLNSATERHNVFDATDEDIFHSVMDAKAVREMDKEGSDETSDGNDNHAERPPVTRNEALEASLLLRQYIKDFDNPFARKLEMMLGSFGCNMRMMKDSKIHSYFAPE